MSKQTYTQPIIILLGPPGSGKGTQAKRLSTEFGLPHISTGDLFRHNIAFETDLGLRVKDLIRAGHLVPDSIVEAMLFDRIAEPDCHAGYILDGFPRTIPQADAFHQHLGSPAFSFFVLELTVPDDVIIKRAAHRFTCKQCGQMFTIQDKHKVGECQKCQGQLFQRPDDHPEVVEERLRVYARQTEPLVEYYTKKGWLTRFDGNLPPDQVFADLVAFLQARLHP